jgi:hypothetical protein
VIPTTIASEVWAFVPDDETRKNVERLSSHIE